MEEQHHTDRLSNSQLQKLGYLAMHLPLDSTDGQLVAYAETIFGAELTEELGSPNLIQHTRHTLELYLDLGVRSA